MMKLIRRVIDWLASCLYLKLDENDIPSTRNHPSYYDQSARHDDSLPGFSRHQQVRLYIGHGWQPPMPSGRLPVDD